MLEYLHNKKIHIVGVSGAEGAAVAVFLAEKVTATFVFHDLAEKEKFEESFNSFHDSYEDAEKKKYFSRLQNIEADIHFKDSYLSDVEQADIIFVPQTWFRHSQNDALKTQKDKLSSITRLYFEIAQCKIVGITGTAGKSTTSKLIHAIFTEAGVYSVLSGNDRHVKQDLEQVAQLSKDDVLVLEISHRQLITGLRKSPDIAVVTNVFPNHKDDTDTFEDYIEVKKHIFAFQRDDQNLIVNADDEYLKNSKSKGKTYYFSMNDHGKDGAFVRYDEIWIRKDGREMRILETRDLSVRGDHNIMNVLAAIYAAYDYGIGTKEIRRTIQTFKPPYSRLEDIGEISGVKIVDDSKGGNNLATISAVKSFSKPVVLLMGGTRKDISDTEFDDLADIIIGSTVKSVVIIGELKDEIENAITSAGLKLGRTVPVSKQESLEDAVSETFRLTQKGDIFLFSPACESFDMFNDYRERTERFREIITSLQQ